MRRWLGLVAAAWLGWAGLAAAQDRAATSLLPKPTAKTVLAGPSLPASPAGAHELTKADLDSWLDGYLPYSLRSGDIPGAVVVVVKDGQVLTARGFGYADVNKRTPVDPARTLFRPGSISKLFTWTAVMQQVEQGRLDLDADVNGYLDFRIPPFRGQPITLRQIMTHTAGFEEVARGVVFFDPKYQQPLGDYLKRNLPRRIFAPGTTPAYSNYATALAAYIVQRRSGEEFTAYLDRHVFAPLGMNHSSFRQPLPPALAPDMAAGYPKPGQPSPGFEYVGPGPAGADSSSGLDMARFMLAHLNDGELDGARILQPATAQEMHNSPLGRVNPFSLLPPLSRMELGFFETNLNGREVIGHLGDTEGFHSSLHLFLREKTGIFFSFNSPGRAAAAGPLRTALFQDFADRYFPSVAPPDGRVAPAIARQHAKAMTGLWWASRRAQSSFLSLFYLLGQSTVGVGPDGGLVIPDVVGANGRPRQWVEVAPWLWRDANGHDRLAAKLVNGRPVRWSFDFASPFEVFDPVPAGVAKTWLVPAIVAAGAVLLLSFLYWPAAFLVRRRYGARPAVAGPALRAYRATRLMAGLDVGLFVAWIVTVLALLGSADGQAGGFDPLLWLLQVAGVVIFFGAPVIAGWNAWLTWADDRRWPRKAWSLLVFLATLLFLYVAWRFGLVALSVRY